MLESVILGFIQGITEWLPISSQGTVAAVGSLVFSMTLTEAASFALWLHLGTSLAALWAFRTEIGSIAIETLRDPVHPSRLVRFILVGSLASSLTGVPAILALTSISSIIGSGAMVLIGIGMLCTAAALRTQANRGTRNRDELTFMDGLLFGLIQGMAAIPGLSRSGLTVAFLLGRRIDKTEALTLSFLMSIPASIGAAIFAGLRESTIGFTSGVLSVTIAAVVGIISIRILLMMARHFSFSKFMGLAGLTISAGGFAQVYL